jgi:hypothetical protein
MFFFSFDHIIYTKSWFSIKTMVKLNDLNDTQARYLMSKTCRQGYQSVITRTGTYCVISAMNRYFTMDQTL